MNKQIIKLAIPNIISNITIPLLGMVDTALMGHLDSLIYVGAIALGSMIFNFIYWGMGFLRMGTLGFTGQALGANNKEEISRVLYRSISIGLIAAVALLLAHSWIIEGGLSLTDSSEAIKQEARNYFYIRIWALPASLMILSMSGWLIGLQNTIYPMAISILSNVVNIAFSFGLVYGVGMQTEGVALGTLIAQYSALIFAMILIVKKYRVYLIPVNFKEIFNEKLKAMMYVNKDIFIRTMGIIFVFSYFTIESANMSDTTLAVNTILFQFFIFFSYMLDGFANAGEALSSHAIGARSKKMLKDVILKTFLFGLYFSLLYTLAYGFFGENIMRLLTNNENIISAAKPLLLFVVSVPIISFTAFIMDGIFIGATASKAMRNTMILATLGIFLPLLHWGPGDELNRLWIAFLAFMFCRGLFLSLSLKRSVFNLIK